MVPRRLVIAVGQALQIAIAKLRRFCGLGSSLQAEVRNIRHHRLQQLRSNTRLHVLQISRATGMGPGSSSRLVGVLAQCALNSQHRLPALLPIAAPQLLQAVRFCSQPMPSQASTSSSFTTPPPPLHSTKTPDTPSTSNGPDTPPNFNPFDVTTGRPVTAAAQNEIPPSSSSSAPGSQPPGGGSSSSSGGSGGENGSGEPGASASSSSAGEAGSSQQSSRAEAETSAHKYWDQLRSSLGGFTTHLKGFAASGLKGDGAPVTERAQKLAKVVAKELYEAVMPREEELSATRAYQGKVAKPTEGGGPADLVVVKRKQAPWEKLWGEWQEKFGHHPLFQRLSGIKVGESPAVKKGQEMVADLKERYENSDHPFVHRVEDIKERFFAQNEAAQAVQEIRARDPSFDMNKFIRSLRADAPRVVQAFLTRDLQTLKQHTGSELQERFAGIFKNFDQMGVYDDPTILFTSDVELVEIRMVDDDPMVVVQFNCQQLRCTRDKFGNVVDGSTDSIQRVYYFWGLQQERQGVVTADGKALPPRWVIKDMMWRSMQALV